MSRLFSGLSVAYDWLFRTILSRIWDKLFLAGSVLLAMLPVSPWNTVNPRRDSGVFLYIGWRILQGEVPYRDIWDHKPPVIFYLNALGVALSGNSRWGIWCIEVLFVLAAAWLGFRLCRKVFGNGAAATVSLLWLVTLDFVIQGGNLTTEYTLPFQFALLALIVRAETRSAPWLWFLIGALTALAFFTKQNTVGIGVAIGLYLILSRIRSRQNKRLMKEAGWIAAGGMVIVLLVIVFFAWQGALADFWSAAFRYNFVHVASSLNLRARVKNLIMSLEPLTVTGLFPLALMGYVMGLFSLQYGLCRTAEERTLMGVGALALPLELVLVNLTDHPYPHYYMALLPVLTIFVGLVFREIFSLPGRRAATLPVRHMFVAGILLAVGWNLCAPYRKQVVEFRDTELASAAMYLRKNTSPGEYVLFWGAETAYNFLAARRSPSRFVYQYPLYKPGYTTPAMVEEFLDDLLRARPVIIDTHNERTPMYEFPVTSGKIRASLSFLQAHYCPVDQVGTWIVYRYYETGCSEHD